MASDNDNTEDLILNPRQALDALNQVIQQAEKLNKTLMDSRGMKGETFNLRLKESAAAMKSMQQIVAGFGTSLTSYEQKFSKTTQAVTSGVVRSGDAIAVQARQIENATKLVQNALKSGFGTAGVSGIKTSVDAIKAYESGLTRIQTLLAKIEDRGAFAGRTTGQKQLLADLAEQQKLTAALFVQKEKLIAQEKEYALAEAELARAEKAAATQAQRDANETFRVRQAARKADIAEQRAALAESQRDSNLTFRARASARKAEMAEQAAAEKEQARRIKLQQSSNAPVNAESLGAKFVRNSTTFANYALIGSAFAGAAEVAGEVVKLDVALHNLQGITQTTDAGMANLRQHILDVASGSKFMASAVADAATILGQAGLSTQQISQSLQAVVVFAQAAGIKLEESVNLLTSAMGAFNLRADESMDIANTFTAALNNSKLTVEQLSAGFQYSASVAAQTGISYKELATTMALMAQAGIKSGSMIGSGIRQILNQLSAPSTKFKQILVDLGVSMDDVDIRSHGLIEVMKTLKDAGFDASEAFKAFGTRGAGAFVALEGQLAGADAMRQSLTGTDAAAKAAAIQMESFGNTAKRFGSTIAALAASGFQPLLTVLQGVLSVGAGFTKWLQNLGPAISVVGTALAVFTGAEAAKYVVSLTGVTTAFSALRTEIIAVSVTESIGVASATALVVATSALELLLSPMVLTIAAVTAAIVGMTYAWNAHKIAVQANAEALDAANAKYADAHTMVEELASATKDLMMKHNDLKSGTPELTTRMKELGEQFKTLGLDTTQLNNNYDQLLDKMRQLRGVAGLKEINSLIDAQTANVGVLHDQETSTDQAQFEFQRLGKNRFARSGINSSAISSAFNTFGTIGNRRPTASDIPSLYAAASSADAQTVTDPSQKAYVKDLHDAILKLAIAVETETKTKGNIAFQGSAIQGLKLRSSGQIPGFTTQTQNLEQSIRDSKPKDDGVDPVEYQKAVNDWVNSSRAVMKKQMDATIAYGKIDQAHQLAISDIQQDLKDFDAYLSTTDEKANTGAKSLREKMSGYAAKDLEDQLAAAKTDQSNATNEADLKKAHGKIRAITIQLLSADAEKVAADLGLRSTDYNTAGGTINVTGGRVTASNKIDIDHFNNEQNSKLHVDDQEYVAKRRSLLSGFDKGTTSGDNAAANAATKTLNEQLAAYIRDAADQFKSLDKYTPTGVVRDHAAAAQKDIENWYAEQIDKINEDAAKKIKNLSSKDTNRDGHTKDINDQAAQQIKDLVTEKDDKLEDIRNKVADLLDNNVNRLPQNLGEAWDNVKSAAADPRKSKYPSSEFATTFQDTMIAVVDKVKTSFGTMWTSIITGSQSAGKAFVAFGRGILETMLNVITNKLTQQFLDLLMGGSSTPGSTGGGIGGIFGSIFQSLGIGSTSSTIAAGANADGSMFFGSKGGLAMRAGGGSVGIVPGKVTTRDSVVASLASGSYVLRQSATAKLPRFANGGRVMAGLMPGEAVFDPDAVASIGLNNLKDLNAGRGLLRRAAGGIVSSNGGMINADPLGGRLAGAATKLNKNTTPHQTNVWVVKPDQQPPMTKNDVLVAVTDDILKNGQTKQMIKSIMNGG